MSDLPRAEKIRRAVRAGDVHAVDLPTQRKGIGATGERDHQVLAGAGGDGAAERTHDREGTERRESRGRGGDDSEERAETRGGAGASRPLNRAAS